MFQRSALILFLQHENFNILFTPHLHTPIVYAISRDHVVSIYLLDKFRKHQEITEILNSDANKL